MYELQVNFNKIWEIYGIIRNTIVHYAAFVYLCMVKLKFSLLIFIDDLCIKFSWFWLFYLFPAYKASANINFHISVYSILFTHLKILLRHSTVSNSTNQDICVFRCGRASADTAVLTQNQAEVIYHAFHEGHGIS